MTDISNIEQELRDATKTAPKKKEARQAWLKRLATSVQELEKDEWDALSSEAQNWYNDAVDEIAADEDIAEPVDTGTEDEEDAEDDAAENEAREEKEENEEEEAEEEPRPARRGGKAPEEKKPAAKGKGKNDDGKSKAAPKREPEGDDDKPTKASKPPRAAKKPAGAQAAIKRAIIEDPSRDIDGILTAIAKEGWTDITRLAISTTRSGMMQTLRLLKEMGKLKGVAMP